MSTSTKNSKHASDSRVLKAIIAGIKKLLANGTLTVNGVAEHCEVYRTTVYDWTTKGRTPNIDQLEKLASLMGYKVTLVAKAR